MEFVFSEIDNLEREYKLRELFEFCTTCRWEELPYDVRVFGRRFKRAVSLHQSVRYIDRNYNNHSIYRVYSNSFTVEVDDVCIVLTK